MKKLAVNGWSELIKVASRIDTLAKHKFSCVNAIIYSFIQSVVLNNIHFNICFRLTNSRPACNKQYVYF